MSAIILEMGHEYLRTAVYKDGAASFVPNQFDGNKVPATLYFWSEKCCSLGHNTQVLFDAVKINHICDSDVLLSSCAAQVDKKTISGKDVAENLLRSITDAATAYLCECVDTVICIVPNRYGRARYLLADAAKKLGIVIRFIKATDCTAYAHVVATPKPSSDDQVLHALHFGYRNVDRAVYEFESNVLEPQRIVSRDTDYVDAFVDRLSAHMISAVFETGLLVDESEYSTILENVRMEAKVIGTMKQDCFPYSLPLKKILGYSVKEPVDITFSWDDMISYARQASKDVLPSVEPILEAAESPLPNTVVVSGEGISYPALRSILFNLVREQGFEPILCEESILELAKYYNYHTENLMLSNAGVSVELVVANATKTLVQEWHGIPARRSLEIRTWGKSRIGIVLLQGGEPVLWGVIPTSPERISAITLEVEIDHSELLEATVQAGGKSFTLQHEGMTALDAFLALPSDEPPLDIPLCEMRNYIEKYGIECDEFDSDELDEEDLLDDTDNTDMIPDISPLWETYVEEDDDLYKEAVNLTFEHGSASISTIQRELKLGYAHSGALIEKMTSDGLIEPYTDGKPRKLLMTREEWDARSQAHSKDDQSTEQNDDTNES